MAEVKNANNEKLNIGVDIGSTTVKVVVLDAGGKILFKQYERHISKVREKTVELLKNAKEIIGDNYSTISLSGSAGLSVAEITGIDFVQEVFATRIAVDTLLGDTDVVIELGGEDAKILFLSGITEERMNGSCAGGTGSFIDQMASLLNVSLAELDELSFKHELIYNIASRCGVFAKSDIQPLLNQGANKADIAASIYQAIVSQTIAGLAQGRELKGKIVFLGGPLTFLAGLQQRFIESLKLVRGETGIFPENSEYYVAFGAAYESIGKKVYTYAEILDHFEGSKRASNTIGTLPALFNSEEEYKEFAERHSRDTVNYLDIANYEGDAFLGIDAGSTTTKIVLITPEGDILYNFYASNSGEPVSVLKDRFIEILNLCGDKIIIRHAAVTGYGEELIKSAFCVDVGIVETIAHYHAAHYFNPNVDFILDIGGQDMKCFKLKNGIVDSIMLNEACSSGCGSFIETFAHALGYEVEEFAKLGIHSRHPVNLGSRCTVFMNSSVKQSQKDGASIEDISAGLAISVIKNAIYKVMGTSQASDLGDNIVVQGGTFLNDPILRAFEREINKNVTRPAIAGLMGAYGAALYGMNKYHVASKIENRTDIVSKLLTLDELDKFTHSAKIAECGLCTNNCKLTVNTFNKGEKFISGNRCERPTGKKLHEEIPNAYDFKLKKLKYIIEQKDKSNLARKESRGTIGILFGLNMFENLPFWFTFFTELGFDVVVSKVSTRELYIAGQHTIPSDTVCYPAKLMHGHIEDLLERGVKTIFYPCIPYNFDEKAGDNHYNCPVVAYYPELLEANIGRLSQRQHDDESIVPEIKYLTPYFSLHNRRFFYGKAAKYMKETFGIKKKNEVIFAAQRAYSAYEKYRKEVFEFGDEAMKYARDNGKGIIILAGRPYHIDPEVNHGIDKVITSLGMVVISEDCLRLDKKKHKLKILNQWTYHSRLYNAAKIAERNKDINLVQMVSFGCGLDAITTGEVKDILEKGDKIYTQIKIDEINNLGAAKIRLRSLIEAIDAHKEEVI